MKRQRVSVPVGSAGFTIIELLIATLLFSLILVLITTGVLQFTRQYYKGVISSNTQNTARAIIDDVTRAIQFNPGSVYTLTSATTTPNPDASAKPLGYCIGETKRYSFALNAQVTDDSPQANQHQSKHALITDGVGGCSTATPGLNVKNATVLTSPDIQTNRPLINARELMSEHMRLSKFSIDAVPGLADTYTVTVRIIYGDDELLCTPSIPESCRSSNTTRDILENESELACKSTIGNQFCAVSELSTTVKKRID